MSKLTALRKQIAALEAKAERLSKAEMTSSIAKVKDLMHALGVTVESLGSNVSKAVKKTMTGNAAPAKKTSARKSGPSIAKYADPKSGKTWSGFGRAPGWIASARNRDAFLVHKPEMSEATAPVKKTAKAAKNTPLKVARKAGSAAKTVIAKGVKSAAPAKKRVAKTASAKKTVARKTSAKKAASPQVANAVTAE